MQKIVIHRPGGFARLELETHPDPQPGPGEVRVSTRAIGVNYADCIVRMGLYKSARELVGFPITPGFELAGAITALGDGVQDLALGDLVFGVTRFGGYSSEIVIPRELCRRIPPGLGVLQAATFSVVFLTAWYALFELCRLRPGSKVLVHSAAGGVGSALCQLARTAGAEVLGVVGSPAKVDVALAQGASRVIDKSTDDLWARAREFAPGGFQAVLDANGAATLRQGAARLAPGGRLVVYGFHTMLPRGGIPNPFRLLFDYLRTPRFHPMTLVDRNAAVLGFNLSYLFHERELLDRALDDLLAKLEAGAIRPLDVTELPLAHADEAQRRLQSGTTTGKLALVP